MKFFKTLFTAILLLTFVAGINAQRGISAKSGNYIHLSGDAGFVLNATQDRKLGIGGNIAFMMKDRWVNKNDKGFWTITVKGFNNPFGDGEFLSSILNKKADAFNYIQFLAGYRYTLEGMKEGVYVEPRIGYTMLAKSKSAFAFVPSVGYTFNNFDFALFCDMGFAGKKLGNQKNSFVTMGVSVGYNIDFNRKC